MSSYGLPFGIESKTTFASLSPSDLESLGKEASAAFLCDGTPLNEAVVKVARRHPSISHHQVQRIIEYANQETFAKVFEKQAGDKNVDFPVADPGVILHELNNGAKPTVMSPPPSDYGREPMKLGYSEVEADLELARVFGVEPISPGVEKVAFDGFPQPPPQFQPFMAEQPYYGEEEEEAGMEPTGFNPYMYQVPQTTEFLPQEEDMKYGMAPVGGGGPVDAPISPEQMAAMEQAHGASPQASSPDAVHHDRMMGIQRDIEFAKKRQELQSIQQKTIEQMQPQGPAVPPGMEGGAPPPGAAPGGPPPGGAPPPGAVPAGPPPGPEAAPAAPPPGPPMPEQIPPPMAGPITAPPGASMPKTGSVLTKEAMAYAKCGRPHSDLVLADLAQATSLERIKKATANRGSYGEADRYGDLLRLKEKLSAMTGEALAARDKNRFLTKEAQDVFHQEVTKHMFDGGNLGEVLHAIDSVRTGHTFDGAIVKAAMVDLTNHLLSKGMDATQAQADAITYSMEKGAALRIANPENPIVSAFANLHKLASNQEVLNRAHRDLADKLGEATSILSEAMLHAGQR